MPSAVPSSDSDGAVRLSRASLFALALNGIVGVGVFFAPATIVSEGGAGSLLPAFGLAFALFCPSLGVFAVLARLLPHDGGPAAHARSVFGERAGFFVGSIGYVAALASTAAVLRALGEAIYPAQGRGVALALLVLFAALVSRGLTMSARVWSSLTVLKTLAIAAFLGAAWAALPASAEASAWSWPRGSSVLVAAFCFQGFEVTSVVAGRGRAARAMIEAFMVAAVVYMVFVWVADRLWTSGRVAFTSADPYGGLASVLGARFSHGLGAIVSLSAGGISFGMVAMTPRYAMAAWPALGSRRALLGTACLAGLLLVVDSLAQLFTLATLAVVAQYAASACALWVKAPRPLMRALAAASLGNCAILSLASSAREAALFVALVFAAALVSRTVIEPTPFRHKRECLTSPPADAPSSPLEP